VRDNGFDDRPQTTHGGTRTMDFSRFKTSDWLKIGGALAFLIFAFFNWIEAEGTDYGVNAFEFFWTGTLPWILLVGVGVLTFLLVQGIVKRGTTPWDMIMLAAAALATLLVLIRLIFNPLPGDDEGIERSFGLYICTLAAIATLVGAWLAFKESGGTVDDFKKLTANRNTGGSSGTAPPPPPGGRTPPPPPPPPSR
jgi:hypothetical protein